MTRLTGKVAIVTGAGRGIGKRIAMDLAKAGASVVVNYAHSEQGALEIVDQIASMNGSAIAVKADISSLEGVDHLVRQAVDEFGRIDILVNNAAVDPTEDFFEVTEAFWDRVVNTNLKGAFFCAQACAREMVKLGKGKIVNISSVHGTLTMPRYAVYASTKGGINAMTRQLALDLAKFNIQVNAIAPGATEVEKLADNPLHDKEHVGSLIPLGRIGYPEDVANVVAFLTSPEADYVTGQIITVDGGSSTRLFLY
ncbi:SDR family NAD(P)-dependent oxidoreductase [Cohnella phaseoli]|uniref:Glucose 1-dehydrogenase/3-oxoacyl-[acyl-carrier protein] reductase n=1 Tax=Cohnella phaseoli TaxID=456490 RepID=A0A3D9JTW3_9BACL|nr:3-oxoacyl-ACP reductase family protein [Cohnella phaseoli]RED76886.1 glucose 1-dehydrogenase/3-oxoacyl-[acyl-carrier protein] reductase [Cohnella phaseoli]